VETNVEIVAAQPVDSIHQIVAHSRFVKYSEPYPSSTVSISAAELH
jgi:hypothetical protein